MLWVPHAVAWCAGLPEERASKIALSVVAGRTSSPGSFRVGGRAG